MPPINQQGSRAALITALVTFVILFVVSTVFAFNYYGQAKQAGINYDAFRKQYTGYLSDSAIQSAPVQALVAAKQEVPTHFNIVPGSSETAIDVALKQTSGLAAVISGAATDQTAGATADTATTALKTDQAALKKAGVDLELSSGGMIGAVNRLTKSLVDRQQELAAVTRQKAAADATIVALNAGMAKVKTDADAANKAQQDANAAALQQQQASIDASNATVTKIQADQDASIARNKAAQDAAMGQVAAAQQQLTASQSQLQAVTNRLTRRPDVTNAAVRVADGRLIRVPGGGVCYINLGYGTGVTNGLTFEVYDKISGVPPIPPNVTGDEQLPVGKASIEIIHVGDNSSECRIVHTEPGAVLTEGDPIANLVYDAHQKYNFDVYGDFDLAGTGRPNAADAEVIKRLVTQWGGKLIDKVTPDTDFLVIGAEPVLPDFAKDDLTPENQDKLQKAQDALDKYQEVRQQAVQLHIPILNQNRFLYYVGYYDQSKR